jgi:hypothetical protein
MASRRKRSAPSPPFRSQRRDDGATFARRRRAATINPNERMKSAAIEADTRPARRTSCHRRGDGVTRQKQGQGEDVVKYSIADIRSGAPEVTVSSVADQAARRQAPSTIARGRSTERQRRLSRSRRSAANTARSSKTAFSTSLSDRRSMPPLLGSDGSLAEEHHGVSMLGLPVQPCGQNTKTGAA